MFAFAYVLSGAAGLLYQVAWLRHLTLAFGHTHAAVSTVLAAFLGGLALGAAFADRAADLPPRRALRWYIGLELLIALYALILPLLVQATAALAGQVYGDGGQPLFAAARSVGALAIVSIPAMLMGATFPFAVRGAAACRPTPLGASTLYALNTIGATGGAALTGFVLLPALGFWRTALVGCAMNIGAGGLAWLVARAASVPVAAAAAAASTASARSRTTTPRHAATARPTPAPATDAPAWAIATGAAVSGFAVLVLEVAWTRILALVLGPTTWAFALMLTLFIGGLALGAVVGAAVARRIVTSGPWMAAALAAGSLATVLTPGAVSPLILDVARAAARPDSSVAAILQAQGLAVALVLLPKTLTLGASFPLALASVLRRAAGSGRAHVGRLYAVNTAGAIAGSLGAGFILMPWLGLHGTLMATSAVLAVGAAVLLLAQVFRDVPPRGADVAEREIRPDPNPARRWTSVAAVAVLMACIAVLAWTRPRVDPRLLSSGAYKYAAYLGDTEIEIGLTAGDLLYYRDGGTSTVSVRRVAGVTSLAIDGKVDASDGGDMLTQKLLGHLPLLLHPAARDVAVIGLGSGVTPGAVLRHPVDRLDVLEISPEVVEASAFFREVSRAPLTDRRTRLIVGDARAHFLFTSRRYDVVISEPSNPWMAGMAALFTQEFFGAVRRRLAPGGVMCQWTHTYDMGPEEFGSIVRTFRSVFPHVLVWLVGEGDVLLVGSDRSLDGALSSPWPPEVARDLAQVGIDRPFPLVSMLVGGNSLSDELAASGAMQSDDRLSLEFSAPRFILGRLSTNLTERIRSTSASRTPAIVAEARASASAADWRSLAAVLERAQASDSAFDAARRALAQDPGDVAAVHLLLDAASGTDRLDEAQTQLEGLSTTSPAAAPSIGLSRIAAAQGDFDTAFRQAQVALERAPTQAEAIEQLASVLADAGDADRLALAVSELQRLHPARPATWYFEASRRFLTGDLAGALVAGRRAIEAGDAGARSWNLVGACHASRNEVADARAAFERARAADRRDVTSLLNLARLESATGHVSRAESLFAEALTIDPTSREALAALADLAERRGDRDRAAHLRARPGA